LSEAGDGLRRSAPVWWNRQPPSVTADQLDLTGAHRTDIRLVRRGRIPTVNERNARVAAALAAAQLGCEVVDVSYPQLLSVTGGDEVAVR
jgi:hypothetical protein